MIKFVLVLIFETLIADASRDTVMVEFDTMNDCETASALLGVVYGVYSVQCISLVVDLTSRELGI